MAVPVVSYGHSILRKVCKDVHKDHPGLEKIISDMKATINAANGLGLAAPQINKSLKMFIVDTREAYEQMSEVDRSNYFSGDQGIQEVFINARINKRSADTFIMPEGCLSIPSIYEEIERNWIIEVEYVTPAFQKRIKKFSGLTARVIQHEIDHTDGILFIDHLSPLKKKLLRSTLVQISKGEIHTDYKMQFIG